MVRLVQAVLTLTVAASWLVPPCCGAGCTMGMAMTCMLDGLNMLSDGAATLRHIPNNTFYAIRVELIRLPDSPSGVFLQRMGEFVEQVEMYVYHEPVFQLLAGTSLGSVAAYSAPALREVVIAPTVNMSKLAFYDCALDHVPATVANLAALEELTIARCAVRNVSFGAFASNPKLTSLDLNNNGLQRVLPPRSGTPFTLAIENLYLSWNRLENLDMAAFVSLTALRGLDLSYNSLLTVAAQSTVTLPVLDFLSLDNNQLQTLDLQWLVAPRLQRLSLNTNAFASVPLRLRRFPKLETVGLASNRFQSIDLAPFNGLPELNSIDLSYNEAARGIRASRPTSLPQLNTVYAERCALARFNTSGLDLPTINFITLAHNNFSVVPRLAAAFPSLESFSLEGNPLPCATVKAAAELVLSGKLILGMPQPASSCEGGYVTLKGSLTLCCKA